VDIPQGYMLTLNYSQPIHLMDGLDKFLIYDSFSKTWSNPIELGYTHDNIRVYKCEITREPLTVGDKWIVVEKI
jgi:hypothetical protein